MSAPSTRIAWVTGSASGLGAALTTALLRGGWQVLASDINADGLSRTAADAGWDERRCRLVTLDVREPAQWRSHLAAVSEDWGVPTLLCNVAGYLLPGYILETPDDQIDRHLDINVKGLIHGCRVVGEAMVEAGRGHIINIASLAGVAPIPGIGLYSTSKFAVRGFSLLLAQELAPKGVRVSVVCPDAIETPMLKLQEDWDEAALTFSAPRALGTADVVRTIERLILHPRDEVLLPGWRGWLAKLGNSFPVLSRQLSAPLREKGLREQRRRHSAGR